MNIFDIFKIIMNLEIYFKLENIYYFKMLNLRVVVDWYFVKVWILSE